MEALEKVEQLKIELDSLRPLNAEAEARIMQKFRLDWNYHSNNIEGNSLTYGETKAFILFGITAGKKPFKDYLEIKGHNEAINWIIEIVKGKTELTEVFIRQLHTLLLKESSESFAQTPDGKPTTKKIEVGKYKTLPNHVLTATGEMFYFSSPEETPAKMHELIDWYRAERENSDVNPIILATLFHYRFIRIHPFDDGNGRTARILMNFILMQNGFPPAIIKTEDKENYYGVLRLADVGELESFIEYIANNLIHSLEIMIRGAKGEDIEEPDDLDKELALLDERLKGVGRKAELTYSSDIVLKLFDNSIIPLINEFNKTCKKFDKFYFAGTLIIYTNPYRTFWETKGEFSDKEIIDFKELLKDYLKQYRLSYFKITYLYRIFRREKLGNFSYESNLFLDFGLTHYKIKSEYIKKNSAIFLEKFYSENLSKNEIQKLVRLKAQKHKEFIEKKLNTKN